MFSRKKTNQSINDCSKQIELSKKVIKEADAIVLGIGSGVSSSGGLDYMNENLVKNWYPKYYQKGFKSIVEIQSVFWNIETSNIQQYWYFWANHIKHIRYDPSALLVYKNIKRIVKNKAYFVITTNCDGQVDKVGFDKDKIYAMQGNYAYFQCSNHCCDEIYYNEKMILNMLSHANDLEIRKEDIPYCPQCGNYLIPNLRCDNLFVEKPHLVNQNNYFDFIEVYKDKKIVFLELGVGMNTPIIIKYPFEKYTKQFKKANLIRINLGDIRPYFEIKDKGIFIESDISKAVEELLTNNQKTQ